MTAPRHSTHYECDDWRHYQFARTCPGFHADRRSIAGKLAWPVVSVLAAAVAVVIALF